MIDPKKLDEWRIVPRLMVILYGCLLWAVTYWFMGLVTPTNSQAAFVSTIVGAAGMIFGFYVNSGNKGGGGQ